MRDTMKKIEQVLKQLHKQIDVLKVKDITDESIVARELALIKIVAFTATTWVKFQHSLIPFRATTIDIGRESMTFQVTGIRKKLKRSLICSDHMESKN